MTRRRSLVALLRREEGSTAVEFALVAFPLVFLIFCIIDLAMVYMVSMSLDQAAKQASRLIRTGQLQTQGGATASSFRDDICAQMKWIQGNCQANLSVDVRTYPTFTAINPPNPVSNGKFNAASLTFAPGNPTDIVLVRGFYKWPLFSPFLAQSMNALSGGGVVITTAFTFRNEPYQ